MPEKHNTTHKINKIDQGEGETASTPTSRIRRGANRFARGSPAKKRACSTNYPDDAPDGPAAAHASTMVGRAFLERHCLALSVRSTWDLWRRRGAGCCAAATTGPTWLALLGVGVGVAWWPCNNLIITVLPGKTGLLRYVNALCWRSSNHSDQQREHGWPIVAMAEAVLQLCSACFSVVILRALHCPRKVESRAAGQH